VSGSDFLTPAQVEEEYGLSLSWLAKMRMGRPPPGTPIGPHYVKRGRRIFYGRRDVERWLAGIDGSGHQRRGRPTKTEEVARRLAAMVDPKRPASSDGCADAGREARSIRARLLDPLFPNFPTVPTRSRACMPGRFPSFPKPSVKSAVLVGDRCRPRCAILRAGAASQRGEIDFRWRPLSRRQSHILRDGIGSWR
jgi:hypothetical protein